MGRRFKRVCIWADGDDWDEFKKQGSASAKLRALIKAHNQGRLRRKARLLQS